MSTAATVPLHVLVLPSWFPEPDRPHLGWFFVDQALALERLGHRVGVIYPRGGQLFSSTSQREHGLVVFRSRGLRVPGAGPLNALLFAREALRLFERYVAAHGRPDVLHVQSACWGALGAALIRRASGVPFVVTEHLSALAVAGLPRWKSGLLRLGFSRAAAIVAVSHALASGIAPLTSQRQIEIVPNTVDVDYFRRISPRRRGAEFTLLAVADLTPNKRLDRAIRGFAAAYADEPRAVLEIGGDGVERGRLQQLTAALGVRSRVRFLGRLSREQVRAAMHRADLLVLTSERETFGVVLIEALAAGLPVIATRAGGPEEIVTSEVGGIVDGDDQAQLVAALRAAPGNVARWGARCEAFARERYDYAVVGARVAGVLRRALAL